MVALNGACPGVGPGPAGKLAIVLNGGLDVLAAVEAGVLTFRVVEVALGEE